MAKTKKAYKVKGSFYLDRIYEDGETVLYDGEPGENLIELKGEAAKAAQDKVDETLMG